LGRMKDVIFLLFLSDHILDRSDLDEGPIIVQDVQPIDHQDSVEQMVHLGHDTEATALSQAVRLHPEQRVMLNGQRTVTL
jgi:formyltetrahydrofolate deformylase